VVATSIHGLEGGLATLEADCCSSMFFLSVRIFHYLGLALNNQVVSSPVVVGVAPI
jgi:hypothetical protein